MESVLEKQEWASPSRLVSALTCQLFVHLILFRSVPNYFIYLSYFHSKSKQGTRFTPMFQRPDNSLSFGVEQAVAWKKSGLMVRPSVQVRYASTCSEAISVNNAVDHSTVHNFCWTLMKIHTPVFAPLLEEVILGYGQSLSIHWRTNSTLCAASLAQDIHRLSQPFL